MDEVGKQARHQDPASRSQRPQEDALKPLRRQFLRLTAGAVMLPALSRFAWAQIYPSRPVRIIVGFAAGGPNDIIARLMGHVWTAPAGQGIFWLSACGRVQVMCPACLRGTHDRWP